MLRSVLARREPRPWGLRPLALGPTGYLPPNPVDYALLLLLWLAFASLTSLHVALAYTVGKRLGKLRGWLALLAFPFAPYFGWRGAAKALTLAWCFFLAAYGLLLFFATR